MKLLLTTALTLATPLAVFAAEHDVEQQSEAQQETTVPPADTHREDTADPFTDEESEEVITGREEISIQEEISTLHQEQEIEDDRPRERFVLFIDALKYRVTTHSVDATQVRDKNDSNLSSSSTTTTLRALDATIGGVLMAGYQLLEGLEVGGLLYISNREKTTSTRRENSVDDQLFTSNEGSTNSSSVHSFGPWLKLRAGNYWQALFAIYYTSSHTEQTSDSGQHTRDTQDTFNNLTTTVARSYFALDLILGPWIPLTERLTFVPQINVTWYLPRAYTQTTTVSSSAGDTLAEDALEFDEHSSLDYSLTLGGLRYAF